MAMLSTRLTAEEFLALPLDRWSQLIDGQVVVASPRWRHQDLTGEIYRLLANWLVEHPGCGAANLQVDVRLDDRNVYAPDVLFVPEADRPPRDALRLYGPPALAVEVRSPSTWRYDTGVKKATYERQGLAELWLVDTKPDRVLVYRRSSQEAATFDVALELSPDGSLTTPLIPGFTLDLAGLFDR